MQCCCSSVAACVALCVAVCVAVRGGGASVTTMVVSQ